MSFTGYQNLLDKISEKFVEVKMQYPQEFNCKATCHSCCKPDLTVSAIEKDFIFDYLEKNPEKLVLLRALEKINPHKSKRCAFLAADGICNIYEARPVMCRANGMPLQFKDPEAKKEEGAMRFREVCELNFKTLDIAGLPTEDILNLDTIHALLAMLNRQKYGKKLERFRLQLAEILA